MNSREIWHVDVQNNIYEANYEEVIEWIKEGAILPDDKVRRGNLRWLNAGKVPEFHQYFVENTESETFSPAPDSSNGEIEEMFTHFQTGAGNSAAHAGTADKLSFNGLSHLPNTAKNEPSKAPKMYVASDMLVCSVHSDRELSYVCQICKLYFCKTCPHSFGSSVKICLDCGGLCMTYEDFEKLDEKTIGAINRPYARVAANDSKDKENEQLKRAKLSTKDFTAALIYPLKFPVALLIGAFLLTILTFGQTVLAIGGINLFTVAAGVSALTLMLIFSVQTKTIENCMRGKTENGFLPGINRFTFWEDLIHPLFLGIGVFLASFGLFIVLTFSAGVYAWTQLSEDLRMSEDQMRLSAKRVNTVLDNLNDGRTSGGANGSVTFEHKIEQNLQNQTERVFGSSYLGDTAQLEKFLRSMLRLSVYFQMPVGFAFILGLLVFPAVCLIAASTRSFGKTVNLLRAFQIIKQIGFDYIKILVTLLAFLMVVSTLVSGIFIALSFFEQSFVGVVAGLTVGSFLAFYLWVSFSKILGIALFKKQIQERI